MHFHFAITIKLGVNDRPTAQRKERGMTWPEIHAKR